MELVQQAAAERFGVSVELQRAKASGEPAHVLATRDAAMLAAYRLCPQPSTRAIGKAFGGRGSSMVSKAIRRALGREKSSPQYREMVRQLTAAGMPWLPAHLHGEKA